MPNMRPPKVSVTPRKAYETDLTDAEWLEIEPWLPPPVAAGAPRTTSLREVLNAIFYRLHNGCAWHALPHDLPPEGTVRDYFHQWRRSGRWEQLHDVFRRRLRQAEGRDEEPPRAASTVSRSRPPAPVVSAATTRARR